MNYYNRNIEEIYKEFSSSKDGIKNEIVNENSSKYGKNIIAEGKRKSTLKRFISQFKDMMIIILMIVAVLMFIYGILYSHDYIDTIVIVVVVFLNAIMGFIQEQKAEVTLEGLKKYSTSSSKIKREDKITVINSDDIVCGDILLLEVGDKVPADARIIEQTNLKVDESPLTGESVPVEKTIKVLKGNHQLQEQTNMIFCGSNIVSGSVKAIVVRTGMNTELGKIAVSLNTPYEVKTPLQKKMEEISKKITLLIFIVIIIMFFYGIFNNYKTMEIIMLCVSLAVAAIPEGLPAVITIALSSGTAALAKKKTIVRQMSAVETLGSTDIICSDKTGTITQNKMQIKKTYINDDNMFKYIAILANETIIDNDSYIGDPTETCLYEYFQNKNENVLDIRKNHHRIISAPFDSDRKMMSSINKIDNDNYILVKGSLESLIKQCSYIIRDGKKEKLNDTDIKKIKDQEYGMAKEALRVLGFAYKIVKEVPSDIEDVLKLETDLIYVGMVGMIDPPRTTVKEAVQKCRKAGIRPVMITGDSFVTACAIAKEVGIIKDESEGLIGSELDKYTDEELIDVVKKYNVYVRVNPIHKSRIVKAWQANGKVVAMTGDGANDAPAIKDAHVGVGMGITGTEVTKSVADVILLDDSFSTIVDAVEEGRRIFSNIRNNVVYSLSSNFAELFLVIIGMLTGNIILLPIHILFIDLITDTIPSICLSFEKSENKIMEKNPRGIDKPIFTPFIKASIVYSAIIETLFGIVVYFVSLKLFDTETAISLTLLTVVVQEILYAISCRNLKQFIKQQGLFSNRQMNIGLIFVIIIELIFFLTPLGKIISISRLDMKIIFIIAIYNLIGFLLYEIAKPCLKRLFSD